MTTHIGMTGARNGCDPGQLAILNARLGDLLADATGQLHLHHGDCIGADEQAHEIAWRRGYRIIGHPPSNRKYRANVHQGECWTPGYDEMLPAKPYLERNTDIVAAVDLLFVLPDTDEETVRSGTWSTYRAAIRLGVQTVLIPPTKGTT